MNVPLLDLKPQNAALETELTAAFERVLRSGMFILGAEVEAFEGAVADLSGAKHGIGMTSGTDAILVALMALGIGPGDEVVCPTFTFFATAGCIARVGATPVFADACPVSFNVDVADVERKITPRTKAIIPVHLFGQAAEMDAIMALAGRHGLAVIEDAAQAMGAGYRGRPVGGIGTFGTISFFPSKNLGGFGDAGMLVTNDDALAAKARTIRNHGMEPKYHHQLVGGNFRIDALQAALLAVKLPHFRDYCEKRRANAEFYTEQLSALDRVVVAREEDRGCAISETADATSGARMVLPLALAHNEHLWNQYTLRIPGKGRREALRAHLIGHDVGCDIYYPRPMHRQECFAGVPCDPSTLENADALAGEVLSIPVFPDLADPMRERVVAVVSAFLAEESASGIGGA